jgi:hypothetical protein
VAVAGASIGARGVVERDGQQVGDFAVAGAFCVAAPVCGQLWSYEFGQRRGLALDGFTDERGGLSQCQELWLVRHVDLEARAAGRDGKWEADVLLVIGCCQALLDGEDVGQTDTVPSASSSASTNWSMSKGLPTTVRTPKRLNDLGSAGLTDTITIGIGWPPVFSA